MIDQSAFDFIALANEIRKRYKRSTEDKIKAIIRSYLDDYYLAKAESDDVSFIFNVLIDSGALKQVYMPIRMHEGKWLYSLKFDIIRQECKTVDKQR